MGDRSDWRGLGGVLLVRPRVARPRPVAPRWAYQQEQGVPGGWRASRFRSTRRRELRRVSRCTARQLHSNLNSRGSSEDVTVETAASRLPSPSVQLQVSTNAMFRSPTLRPLDVAPSSGIDVVTLMEEKNGKASDVWLFAFDSERRERIAHIIDCSGMLQALSHRAEGESSQRRFLVLACVTPSPPGYVSHNLIWSEIVDVEARVRWRTTRMVEAFFRDGVAVLSTRRSLTAESKTAPGDLYSVDIVESTSH